MYWIFSLAGAGLVAGLLVYLLNHVFGLEGHVATQDHEPGVVAAKRFRENCELTAANLRQVKFTRSVRGYDPEEVDALLERLAAQLGGEEQEKINATEATERA